MPIEPDQIPSGMRVQNEDGHATGRAYHPLVLVVCALAAGIGLERLKAAGVVLSLTAALALFGCWLGAWYLQRNRLASWLNLATVFFIGLALHHLDWRLYRADEISQWMRESPQPACVEVLAMHSPRWSPAPPQSPLRTIPKTEESELLVWVTAIRDDGKMRPASGWAELVVRGRLEVVRAGDRLRVMSQASRPSAPLNPGEFDFALHQRAQRLNCRLFAEFPQCVERLPRGSVFPPRRWLADVRSRGVALLHRYIAPERATLASAILLGAREQLDPDQNENYLVTGTIHVLSISGLHVGIFAAGLFFLLRFSLLPQNAVLVATIALTAGYALLTDMQPPVVRATVLVVAACLAIWAGRAPLGFNTLAAAALVVLAMNPASLFMAGPQLSFLAVATMIAFQPILTSRPIGDPLKRLIAATRPWPVRYSRKAGAALWHLWLLGAVIWFTSTPLVWERYNLISPSALVLNFLLWLPITLAMYSGVATLALGSFIPVLGRLGGQLCETCLQTLEATIAAGRHWPLSHWWLPAPPAWWVAIFYVALGLFWAFPPLRPPRRWLVVLTFVWISGALWLVPVRRHREATLACTFVAVGHGVCVLVEFPDGKSLLYDAGRLGSPLAGVRPISSVLWDRGISHLDALVISHADADHFNAIPGLLERFSVGVIYVSPTMFGRNPPAVAELRKAIDAHDIAVREIWDGVALDVGSTAKAGVLHPPPHGVNGSDNANSLVLSIEHAGRRLILTGDLETPGLEEVLIRDAIDFDVVLAPHHGSARSSPSQFADWSSPEHVIISGGLRPGDQAAIERVKDSFRRAGAEVYHTAEDGCVRVEIGNRGVEVSTHRPHVRSKLGTNSAGDFLQTE